MKENTKKIDWCSTLMKMGASLIAIAFCIIVLAFLIGALNFWIMGSDFEVTEAVYYTDCHETAITLTYTGSSPVNVSVYHEFYFDGQKGNRTLECGIMKKGDLYYFGSWGYTNWCEVIYNGNRIKLTFTPERTTLP